MELIREQLLYKQNSLTICLGTLGPQEHYECIRLLLATRTKDVSICLHSVNNPYVLKLVETLNCQVCDCSQSSQSLPGFDHLSPKT
jgi:hypothetical protein